MIYIPETVKAEIEAEKEKAELAAKPKRAGYADKWQPHLGNNHYFIKHDCKRGGGINFREHLDKPLSDQLYVDLVERLQVRMMRVYEPGMAQWCDGLIVRCAIIQLNKDKNVTDIYLVV